MNRKASIIGSVVVVLACSVLPWAGTLKYPFLHDDNMTVVNNPLVDGTRVDVAGIFTTTGWGDIAEYKHVANYRPLSLLTVSITRFFAGLNPVPFRVTNILLYAALCLLLLALMYDLGAGPTVSTIAASWFALHGTHVETVMFIVNREILLASLFYLAALRIVVRRSGFTAKPLEFGPAALAGLAMTTFLGLLSKESAITMPFVATAILLISRPAGVTVKSRLLPVAAMAFSVGAYFAVRFAALGKVSASAIPWQDNPLVLADFPTRLAGSMKVLVEAARLLALPFNMTVDYSFDVLGLPGPPPGAPIGQVVTGACIMAGVLALIVVLIRRRSAAWPGLVMMTLTWGLVSSIVFPSWIILGERLLTEPSAGLALAMAAGSGAAVRGLSGTGWQRRVSWAICGVLVLWTGAMAVLTMDRIPDYRDAETLFQSSLANRPGSTRLHNNIGQVLMDSGRWAQAEPYLRTAIAIDPANAEAHNNLGLVLANAGRPAAGAAELVEALKVRPNMPAALTNLCIILASHEDWTSALPFCEKAVRRGGHVQEQLERARAAVQGAVPATDQATNQ